MVRLFLMDPVDGTPPFSSPKRFPIFLDENFPILTIPKDEAFDRVLQIWNDYLDQVPSVL